MAEGSRERSDAQEFENVRVLSRAYVDDSPKQDSETEDNPKKLMKWYWWLIGIAAALLTVGFYTSERLATYETKEDVKQERERHSKVHDELEDDVEEIKTEIIGVKIEQAVQAERAKLSDIRLELIDEMVSRILSSTENEGQGTDRRIDDLRKRVHVQEIRMERVEGNLEERRR